MTNIYLETQKDKLSSKGPNPFSEIRIQKILDYARRQLNKTDTEKKFDFDTLNAEQHQWFDVRMAGPARTWLTWNSERVREEWTPWNSFGEPINLWRFYDLK